jgi:hypothetical protein
MAIPPHLPYLLTMHCYPLVFELNIHIPWQIDSKIQIRGGQLNLSSKRGYNIAI